MAMASVAAKLPIVQLGCTSKPALAAAAAPAASISSHQASSFFSSNLVALKQCSSRPLSDSKARVHKSRSGFVVKAEARALPDALLFDCDGVLVDTERDGHRISFNIAFSELNDSLFRTIGVLAVDECYLSTFFYKDVYKGLPTVWDVELYGELLKIGGGKERMTHYYNKVGWPETAPTREVARKDFIAGLHKRKTDLFMELVDQGSLPLRPGVASLIDQALDSGVSVAVCSTSNEKAVSAIVRVMLGEDRAAKIRIFAGDIVPRKKPDPAIYQLAARTLGVSAEKCVVIEDSHIGLTAAKAAGMKCIVTKSGYTEDEDFSAADAVFPCIGDKPSVNFDLDFAASLLTSTASSLA
ncbi:hypothetical protein AXG93_2884s1140 [Marchantia polymorpha subsp. ruderalis]|uniref:Haloacid dehalogenase-like hydrolase domain-containing protein n=1 Tax=Marchantia polymorpha subsp. ruderalis TaxID=1480154 RepID=A0A176WM60_MARPO|nr:hypothetical protein AXG93_2884s1140 [Marchantia polymorpha subsp. ruderalis]